MASRLSARDRRVRLVPRGLGGDSSDWLDVALKRTRGSLVTVVDGGDGLIAGACQLMIQCLERSGSEAVVARSRSLTPAAGDGPRTGPSSVTRLAQPLAQVPGAVEDLVAGAVIARRELWTPPRRLVALPTPAMSLPRQDPCGASSCNPH